MFAATIVVFKKRNDRHDTDWFYTTCFTGKDIGSCLQVVVRRVLGVRRARATRPHQHATTTKIVRLYAEQAGSQKWLHKQGDGNFPEPAPHPTRGSTKEWKQVVRVAGTAGLMIQSLWNWSQNRLWTPLLAKG